MRTYIYLMQLKNKAYVEIPNNTKTLMKPLYSEINVEIK